MQSETLTGKGGFRSETKVGIIFYAVEKAPFNARCFDYEYDIQLDQTVGKTEIFDPTRQSDS